MMYCIDERSRRLFSLLVVVNVVSLISSVAMEEHNALNGINKLSNFNQSELKQEDALMTDKIGLFVFTQYCGPGERIWKTISGQGRLPNPGNTYADIDVCCKRHDDCPNYILSDIDYERYSGLPRRSHLFARLQCSCDAQFFSCLNDLSSQYASTVAFGYGLVQQSCFDLNYPIVGCNKYSNSLLPLKRCTEYKVDDTKDKSWQWFDVPPASSKIYNFPRTTL